MKRTASLLMLAALVPAAIAQNKDAAPAEPKPICDTVVATLMIAKVDCTAALCNTGSAREGLDGVFSRMMARDSIDAASFGSGIAAMLGTALKNTGCFELFDPVAADALRKDLAAAGGTPTAAPTVHYMIKVSVTKAERSVDQTKFLFYKKETATSTLALDTKLVHPARGSVLVAGNYEASSDRASSGFSVPLFNQSNSAGKADPFAGAAGDVVVKAANGLTRQILAQAAAQPTRAAAPPESAAAPVASPVASPASGLFPSQAAASAAQ